MEHQQFEEVWDKKKIFIAVVSATVIVGGGVLGYHYVLPQQFSKVDGKSIMKQVAGVRAENKQSQQADDASVVSSSSQVGTQTTTKIRETVQEKISTLQDEVKKIDVTEVASSSPQIQKVLQDLQNLQQYPNSKAKEVCENICKSL